MPAQAAVWYAFKTGTIYSSRNTFENINSTADTYVSSTESAFMASAYYFGDIPINQYIFSGTFIAYSPFSTATNPQIFGYSGYTGSAGSYYTLITSGGYNGLWSGGVSTGQYVFGAVSAGTLNAWAAYNFYIWLINGPNVYATPLNRHTIYDGQAAGAGVSPYLYYSYGTMVTDLYSSSGLRNIGLGWSAQAGADYYNVYRNGSYIGYTYGTGFSDSGITYASRNYDVRGVYDGSEVPASNVVSAAPMNPASYTPTGGISAAGDTPIRKRVRVTKPTDTTASPTSYDYMVTTANGSTSIAIVTSQTAATTDLNMDGYGAQTVRVYYRLRWSDDGTVSAWSSNYATVSITQPLITGLTATISQNRQITWNWSAGTSTNGSFDASSYNIEIDGGSPISVAQTGGAISYTGVPLAAGSHSAKVTPIYTNGYTGAVTTSTVSGTSVLPTPNAPVALGDTPNRRNVRATAQSAASSFTNASSWDFRLDSNDATILNGTVAQKDFSAIAKGFHTVQVRAKWTSPADTSPWSAASNTVSTTAPPPTSVGTRQKGSMDVAATASASSGGTSVASGTYYVAVSVNYGGTRATETVNSTTRAVNESTISVLPVNGLVVASNYKVTVNRPSNCTGSDTWNVYMGTERNKLKRVATDLTQATATTNIMTYTAPVSNEARIGEVDLQWTAPTAISDSPVGYKVERAPTTDLGTPSFYSDLTTNPNTGFYYTGNTRFWNDKVDTGYWTYKVTTLYSNDQSSPVEITVLV